MPTAEDEVVGTALPEPEELAASEPARSSGGFGSTEIIAILLSILWLGGALLFFTFTESDPETGENTRATFMMTFLAVFMPVALIWVAASAARSARIMREESARVEAALDALRQTYLPTIAAKAQTEVPKPQPPAWSDAPPPGPGDLEAVPQPRTEREGFTFASRRDENDEPAAPAAAGQAPAKAPPKAKPKPAEVAAQAKPATKEPAEAVAVPKPQPKQQPAETAETVVVPKAEPVEAVAAPKPKPAETVAVPKPKPAAPDPQSSLELETPYAPPPPRLSNEDFIRAIHFPKNTDDELGFAALRRALQHREIAEMIQSAQDILTFLSEDGIYTDDLAPEKTPPELWRRFAAGERGGAVAGLAAIKDPATLSTVSRRMRDDQVFRDTAHHFLRKFDQALRRFEHVASEAEIEKFAETRSARAFMLLGNVAGTFD